MLHHNDLAGVYFNPAYGTITLCSYPLTNTHRPTRKECEGLISEAILPFLNHTGPTLLTAIPKLWLTHLLLHHNSGNKFDARAVLTFPAPFPDAPKTDEDGRSFAIMTGVGSAEFVFTKVYGKGTMQVEGIAFSGVWGAGLGVKSPKGEGRESAEVWFDRVT